MNARTQRIHLTVEWRQIEEALSCVFHTILLHRSVGKFCYKEEGSYSIGVIGTEDVDCEMIDLTYVRVNSPELVRCLRPEVLSFRDAMTRFYQQCAQKRTLGRISLELYQRRRRQWSLMSEDAVPWEIWHLTTDAVIINNESEFQQLRDSVGERLSEAVLDVCDRVNRPQYLPKMPVRTALGNVFDERFSDVQPYLFRISHSVGGAAASIVDSTTGRLAIGGEQSTLPGASEGLSTTVKKLIKDTLSL